MSVKQKVLDTLKPKVKQFGFTKKVVKSIADDIADKLDIADDASDEDVDTEINAAIEAALPYLALIQSQANGLHEEWRKKQEKSDDDDDADDGEAGSQKRENRSTKSTKAKDANDDDSKQSKAMADLMNMVSALTKEVTSLKEGKTADSRRSKLETLLKDTGAFGKRTLKNFSKMNFKDDDDFEEFLSDVEDDLKALNQERADQGLSTMGNPPGGKGEKREKKEEAFSDDEIDAMAN